MQSRTWRFYDIYNNVDDFISDYYSIGITTSVSKDEMIQLYYLLVARFMNSSIAYRTKDQFKIMLFSIVSNYGPVWEKKRYVRNKLLSLSDDEIRLGSKAIRNAARNPDGTALNDSTETLGYLDEQDVTTYQKNALEGYDALLAVLEKDVNNWFLAKFSRLFLAIEDDPDCIYIEEEE